MHARNILVQITSNDETQNYTMKKILLMLIATAFLAVNFTAQAKILKKVKNPTDERAVKDFTGLVAGGPINVVVKLGNTESLRFEGDEDAIATLVTEVRGGILIIRPENSWKSWEKKYENKKITAYVTAKVLKSITMSGSGSIVVNSTISANSLTLTISGSGSIKASADVGKLTGMLSGSGSFNLSGSAESADVTLSGSGSFAGKNFKVKTLSTRISGSGNLTIYAENNISAFISGSGNVNYYGNAKVDKTVIGSGQVTKM